MHKARVALHAAQVMFEVIENRLLFKIVEWTWAYVGFQQLANASHNLINSLS